jgi:IS30 family transposase
MVRVRAGWPVAASARDVGVSRSSGYRLIGDAGPVMTAADGGGGPGYRLGFADREEIAVLHYRGCGVREIARRIGRSPATVSRELHRGRGMRGDYRAGPAQARAQRMTARPKPAKLAGNEALRRLVQDRLMDEHSPEQIAARLKADFPDDPQMRVSHETIYQSIYVQGRGALRRELAQRLRTGRVRRHHHRPGGQQRYPRIPGMVNISERPPEVEDRAVPGHWEGDLITGSANKSAIGTLVERSTGFVQLLHLPHDHGAEAVADAITTAMARLPAVLRKTLTWDQGSEMTNHVQIADATGLDIYFCDPRSPWQRGSNENTNGLLRQYFPKGSDLSIYQPDYLDHVAAKLNNRPRKRHDWRTPAEVLDRLLSHPPNQPGVALTG